jgi:predicted  nucleic acid-binding Zn-ribbon protein
MAENAATSPPAGRCLAMARAPRIFTWSDGFHRYTVAATSRAKALAAWETDRDLFKEGMAQENPEAPDAKAALAAPGAVIRRAEGGLKAAVEKLPRRAAPKGPSRPDLKRDLEAARAALAKADAEQEQAEADLEARRRALEDEAADLRDAHEARRTPLARAVSRLEAQLAQT